MLGWVAKTDLDKGLELTIKEYKKLSENLNDTQKYYQ